MALAPALALALAPTLTLTHTAQVFPFLELRSAAVDLRDGSDFSRAETERRVAAQLDTLIEQGVRPAIHH